MLVTVLITPLALAQDAANSKPAVPPKSDVPVRPLENSDIVIRSPQGGLVVGQKTGKGVDGIKLSQHDLEIGSPSVAVAPDGTIHAAFVEKHRTSFGYAAYHRSSADGGKTWTEAKNLTEDMPGLGVGRCQVLADAQNRVYVIWRAGLAVKFAADINPHSGRRHCSLWFRVLEGGKWTKAKPIHPLGTPETQNTVGSLSYFAAVDAAGRAQVVWNTTPDEGSHPEIMFVNGTYRNRYVGVGNGQVWQATLDGANGSAPREVFFPVLNGLKEKNGYCDGLDTLNGYFDSDGSPHLVAAVESTHNPLRGQSRYELIEGGKAGQIIDLPELSFHAWSDMPTLLLDAKGNRHIIALYLGGEHPNVRDYLAGSDDDPTVIRAASGVRGKINGFQAWQGPGGRMVVIMQINDGGGIGDGDNYVSVSLGDGQWSPLVNVTNNGGRQNFASLQTSSESHVAVETNYVPGVAAAAFDREGHLLLLMVNSERSLVASTAFGVNIAGGSTSTPALRFLRF